VTVAKVAEQSGKDGDTDFTITVVGAGMATITFASADGGATTTLDVIVTQADVETEVATGDPEISYPQGMSEETKATLDKALADTEVADLDKLAASHVTEVTDDQVNRAIEALKNVLNGQDFEDGGVNVYVQTYLNIKVSDYTPAADEATDSSPVLSVDITPMSRVVATTADDPDTIVLTASDDNDTVNAVVLDDPDSKKEVKIDEPVTLTIGVGSVFDGNETIQVKHTKDAKDGGKSYLYTGKVAEGAVTFTNPHGFSGFVLGSSEKAIASITTGTDENAVTVGYLSLQDAINDAQTGDTIVLESAAAAEDVDTNVLAARTTKNVKLELSAELKSGEEEVTPIDVTINGTKVSVGAEGASYTYRASSGSNKNTTTPAETTTPATTPTFTDVPSNAYYADAVSWAVEKGITNGTSDTKFSPNAGCTRAQVVTFLWRAAGEPAASGTASFGDVASNAYYADAVAWAVEQGITNGTGNDTFSPDKTCTRAQIVTFLARYAQGKASASDTGFTDVTSGAYYADAVAWAVENGITNGTTSTTFAPNDTCTRGQVVTFLYRAVAE
jgi:hypothetical protein